MRLCHFTLCCIFYLYICTYVVSEIRRKTKKKNSRKITLRQKKNQFIFFGFVFCVFNIIVFVFFCCFAFQIKAYSIVQSWWCLKIMLCIMTLMMMMMMIWCMQHVAFTQQQLTLSLYSYIFNNFFYNIPQAFLNSFLINFLYIQVAFMCVGLRTKNECHAQQPYV